MRRIRLRATAGGVAAAMCVAWLTPSPARAQGRGPTRVVVAETQVRDMPATATLVGSVDAVRRSRVGAEVGGIVVEMPVRQGDAVTAGDLICRLDDELVRFQLDEARARLGSLKAVHEELVTGTRPEVLARLEAIVAEAEARRQRWAYEVERVRRLYSDKEAGSQKEVYDAEAELASAVHLKAAAEANYEEAKNGPRREEIARAAYDVAEQESVVQRLERELRKTRILAPFDGYVVRRAVEVGEWVASGDEVVEIADLSTVLVRVYVPEFALAYCTEGTEAGVRIDALQRTYAGHIKHRIPLADATARTFPVEIEVDNADRHLAAGMFARATVPSGPDTKSVAVPRDAVTDRQGTSYIALVMPGERGLTAMPTPVAIGADAGGWVAIKSDNVPPGAQVVIRGNERIMFPEPVALVDELGRPIEKGNEGVKEQGSEGTKE